MMFFGIALAFLIALIVIGAWAFYEIRNSEAPRP
jgi:flagellar biogenesis protein FliO